MGDKEQYGVRCVVECNRGGKVVISGGKITEGGVVMMKDVPFDRIKGGRCSKSGRSVDLVFKDGIVANCSESVRCPLPSKLTIWL